MFEGAIATVPVPARTLLVTSQQHQQNILNPFHRTIVSFISYYLDENGAGTEWNLRSIAFLSTIIFLAIRLILHKRYRIDWYGFIHSIITGIGSLLCIYLNEYVIQELTGTPEPLGTITSTCMENNGGIVSITSLHRILPSITLGFAIIDVVDGIQMGIDFAIHGAATLLVFIYFTEIAKAPSIIAPMLVLENSTIFLYLVTAAGRDSSPTVTMLVLVLFTISFVVFRIIIFPYIHIKLMLMLLEQQYSPIYQQCYPSSFIYVCGGFGLVFHTLNAFWLYKIIMKIRRKVVGIEKLNAGNELPNHFHKNNAEEEKEKETTATTSANENKKEK